MTRRALALALLLLVTGCGTSAAGDSGPTGAPAVGSAAAAAPSGSTASPVGPAPPAAGATRDDGSGIAPPALQTYGAKLSEQRVAAVRAPRHLRVPDIGVDGDVDAIGVGPDGQLAVPAAAGGLSWYRYGPSPGDAGSAVVAGHVDYNGAEGVFWRLDELPVGSRLEVGYDDGTTRGFTVTARKQYPKSGLPVAEVFATAGPPRLVLVTCGGSFDSSRKSYRDNIVVSAVPT